MANDGSITLKWNTNDTEIRTRSIEKILEPLIINITTLVNNENKNNNKRKNNRSTTLKVLIGTVKKAIENFIEVGSQLILENPDVAGKLRAAINNVAKAGESLSINAKNFALDPTSSEKRVQMSNAARSLLRDVTRLLILADMIDVHLLLKITNNFKNDLDMLKDVSTNSQLIVAKKKFDENLHKLMIHSTKRQHEIKNSQLRDNIAYARATLKKSQPLIMASSKLYVDNHDDKTKRVRDNVLQQMCKAVDKIENSIHGKAPDDDNNDGDNEKLGELVKALDDFDVSLFTNPVTYRISTDRPNLEHQLDSIVDRVNHIAEFSRTRDDRREKIINGCNSLKDALQHLLSEFMDNANGKSESNQMNQVIDDINKKTWNLRHDLRKGIVDNVSDYFLDTSVPLFELIIAAENGDKKKFEECSIVFKEHAVKLSEVGLLACTMSEDNEGIKMVRFAVEEIQKLYPQLIDSATILVANPDSQLAKDNMLEFQRAWENQVKILTEAVDDITTIVDFLAISEDHIREDRDVCAAALEISHLPTFVRSSEAINGRARRVCNVVHAYVAQEMSQPQIYAKPILNAIMVLQDQMMPRFLQGVKIVIDNISKSQESTKPLAEQLDDFIEAANLIYRGVREVRRAILMNRYDKTIESDDEEQLERDQGSRQNIDQSQESLIDEYPGIVKIKTAQDAMNELPDEAKEIIVQEIELFGKQKEKFDREIEKWDESGNDIILMAKKMCMILMEMTDFTRGRGPLKRTMHVINAAKKISEAGIKLDKLITEIIDQCPNSSTKDDLLAYLPRIGLYCHQINITSKVKAEVVQHTNGQLVVSGLDSATSLIQAAKNLMNAVALTVKASYIASTKYPRNSNAPIVVWKMAAPEKKPLVRRHSSCTRNIVRKESQRKTENPLKTFLDFTDSKDTF